MTYLIIGTGGQLGEAFGALLTQRRQAFRLVGQAECDLSEPDTIELDLRGVRCVFNCAAYTNVDAAETDEETAARINGHAVATLARQCREADIPLVHYSTDYVFDGRATEPYTTEQKRAPLGAYGRTKALGEELLEASRAEYLLVRTSWVYAAWGNNFVRTMARLMKEKPSLKVVDDQRGRPTHVMTLAERSLALLEMGQRGIFHVADEGECTWFGFASAIREVTGASCDLVPCTTRDFPRPAPRPAYSVLDTSRADALLGPAPSYRARLAAMSGELDP